MEADTGDLFVDGENVLVLGVVARFASVVGFFVGD